MRLNRNIKGMSSYRRILYHLVLRTKHGHPTINRLHERELYAYIYGYVKNKNCFLYRINGVENHLHLLSDLHPSIALADYIRDMKASSSFWMKNSGKFPGFVGWCSGYAAFTYAWKEKDRIVAYIKRQKEHHGRVTFEDELRRMLREQGVIVDERFFP